MNYFKRSCLTFFLTFTLLGGLFAAPKQAGAIPVVEVGGNLIQSIISAIVDLNQEFKEFVLDGLAKAVADAVAVQLKTSIINWINSGFEGSPSFVTDLEGFLLDVGDEVAADFISRLDDSTQSLICTPFQLNIKYSLTLEYYGGPKVENRCSLDEVFANAERVDSWLDGNFSEGGWKGWFKFAVEPGNDPYGSYLTTKEQLRKNIYGARETQKQELEWADGFFSQKVCGQEGEQYRATSLTGDGIRTIATTTRNAAGQTVRSTDPDAGCTIVTPGRAVVDSLASVVGDDLYNLGVVDEFNEIVTALVVQLSKEILTGAGGLLGTSKPQQGRPSSLNRLQTTQQQQSQSSTINAAKERTAQAIQNENQYLSAKKESLRIINETSTALLSLEQCLATKPSADTRYTELFAFASSTRLALNTASSTIGADVAASNAALKTLSDLDRDAKGAFTSQTAQTVINTLNTLTSNNTIHDGSDAVSATREYTNVSSEMQRYQADIQTRLTQCLI
jgi:hypothetical protein